jgi:hypothetical protein
MGYYRCLPLRVRDVTLDTSIHVDIREQAAGGGRKRSFL